MTLAESMALAVLKGDIVAAYALADLLAEERGNSPPARSAIRRHMAGEVVYAWPEFVALCERLGVRRDASTLGITIRLAVGEAAEITQTYYGHESGGAP